MPFNLTRLARETGLKVLMLACAGLVTGAGATELSGNMDANDIREAAAILSLGSIHRAWTAPAVEGEGLGLSLGLETSFVFRRDLIELGDGKGIAPKVIPVPRLWMAWDLPDGLSISGSIAPGSLFDGIQAYGAGLQYVFFEDADSAVATSLLFDYTYTNAFDDLRGSTLGASLQITKDLTLWQPYAGAGLLVTNARAAAARLAAGTDEGPYTVTAVHAYLGVRLDLLAKLGLQVDMMGTKPSASVLLSNVF